MSTFGVSFGHSMRQHFLQDEKWINLNHGSHGTHPKQVADARAAITRHIESAPDRFLRYEYKTLLNESRRCVADYLHVPVEECVLVQNVTTAMDTVLRNLTFEPKDAVLCFETTYDAVEKSLLCVQETFPQLSLFKVGYGCATDFRLPMSHADIVSLFQETILVLQKEGYAVKAAVLDTITSIPAVRLPFEQLTEICRRHGILSVVDGAHGVGQIPLDLAELDADFFVSNCHKWLFTPRSCAVLHVPRRNHHLIRNTVPTSYLFVPRSGKFVREASRGEEAPGLVELFQNIATMDNTPLYCIPAALKFRGEVCGGEKAIFEYIKMVTQQGADIIAKVLNTSVMQEGGLMGGEEIQNEMPSATSRSVGTISPITPPKQVHCGLRACAMATIGLPLKIRNSVEERTEGEVAAGDANRIASWMQKTLTEYNTTASIFVYEGEFWVRVMGQIYLELADFEWFAGIVKELCDRVRAGEYFEKA